MSDLETYDYQVLKVKFLHPEAKMPGYAKPEDAGFDLSIVEDCIIEPNETKLLHTGLAFDIPQGYYIQISLRSGFAKSGKFIQTNGVGIIDKGYKGEVMVLLKNITTITQKLEKGTRICQGVLLPLTRVPIIVVKSLEKSDRGQGGFGSTGKF